MNIIKTVYQGDKEILQSITTLFLKENNFHLDPTYSSGKFYKGLSLPTIKSDLYPKSKDVVRMDCTKTSFESSSIKSICFDPPFLAGYTKGKTSGIIGNRFEGFRYMKDVWEFYKNSLNEFYRILEPAGILAFKCQDTISSGKQFFTHCFIKEVAEKLGFETLDLFINVAKSRLIGYNCHAQKHARKFHSYWWVFKKK